MRYEKYFRNKYIVMFFASISCCLWASVIVVVKYSYFALNIKPSDTYTQFLFAGYRFLFAGIFILGLYYITGHRIKNFFNYFKHMVWLGIIAIIIKYILLYKGIAYTTSLNASISSGSLVLWNMLFAGLFVEGECWSIRNIFAFILGFFGILLVNIKDLFDLKTLTFFGSMLIILTQLFTSISNIYVKNIKHTLSITALTGLYMIFGALFFLIFSIPNVGFFPFVRAGLAVWVVLYLAFAGAIAFSLWNLILRYNIVGNISMYLFLTPILGTIFSLIFLGDKIDIYCLLGLILVCFSIFSANFFGNKNERVLCKKKILEV